MNSFDIFDTLIGRWYYSPDSIFEEVEKEVQLPNFVWMRKHAENLANPKTLDQIYLELQRLAGISDDARELIKHIEFDLECRHSFPIMQNMLKVKTEDVLISDTYFNKEQLESILDCNGFPRGYYKDIIVSYDGKSSGRVWSQIRPDLHTGDNIESDYAIPQRYGIRAELYTGSKFSAYERDLADRGWINLAKFARVCRLTNPETSDINISLWEEQATKNIPFLVLLSTYLYNHFIVYKRFLFTQRDCVHLERFFGQLFPNVESRKFYTSRNLYENPTENFKEYVLRTYDNQSIIIDLQGTGKTCARFFNSVGLRTPNYFTVVNSDLDEIFNFPYLVHRRNGFTDVVERLNYDNVGRTVDIDLDLDYPVRDNFATYPVIETQHRAIENALFYLKRGFNVYDISPTEIPNNVVDLIALYLSRMEEGCEICKYVNHEAI